MYAHIGKALGRSLGADAVIDYTRNEAGPQHEPFDLIFDTIPSMVAGNLPAQGFGLAASELAFQAPLL